MALDLSIQVHEFTLLKKNLLFAEQHKNEMLLKLQNEVKLGRILGPFKNMPISTNFLFKNCCVFFGNIDLPNPLLSGLKSEPEF
jgi:hypothetical protein